MQEYGRGSLGVRQSDGIPGRKLLQARWRCRRPPQPTAGCQNWVLRTCGQHRLSKRVWFPLLLAVWLLSPFDDLLSHRRSIKKPPGRYPTQTMEAASINLESQAPNAPERWAQFDVFRTAYKHIHPQPIHASILVPKTLPPGARPLLVRFHGGAFTEGFAEGFLRPWYSVPSSPATGPSLKRCGNA